MKITIFLPILFCSLVHAEVIDGSVVKRQTD
jgi:hypothetical protein